MVDGKFWLIPTKEGLLEGQVEVHYDPTKFSRKQWHEDDESAVHQHWLRKLGTKSSTTLLYNASKFRLASAEEVEADAGGRRSVRLLIGLTTYKDMLGTHFSSDSPARLQAGQDQFQQGEKGLISPFDFTSSSIGTGALARTRDGYIILIRKSDRTNECPGFIDRPGGHPEPALAYARSVLAADIYQEVLDGKDDPDLEVYHQLTAESVRREIFASSGNELRDEINIEKSKQSQPLLLGAQRDLQMGGRCCLDFLIDVDLSKDQVMERFSAGTQAEAFEVAELHFLPPDVVAKWSFHEEDHTKRLLADMSGPCEGSLRLLQIYLQNARNR